MKQISAVGVDIAKRVFFAVGMDEMGHVVFRKKVYREELAEWAAQLPVTVIGMEACGGSHYWARVFGSFGHTVKLIPPQFVKPYVKSNKNDNRDAEAICEALMRPTMRFVAVKSQTQQELQMLHRSRERVVKERTALVNEIRGFLHELGIVMPQGIAQFRRRIVSVLEAEREGKLSALSHELFMRLYAEFQRLEDEVSFYDELLLQISREHPECERLKTIPGIGSITATALIAAVGDPSAFKNGRQFAASLGLVPRQHSSGGKDTLLGISKRGNPYLRKLLVHGARSVLNVSRRKSPEHSPNVRWIHSLVGRRGAARATVAIANKNARIVWAVLARSERFDPNRINAVA
jgi:transposase